MDAFGRLIEHAMTELATSNGVNSDHSSEQTPFEKQRDALIVQITQVAKLVLEVLMR